MMNDGKENFMGHLSCKSHTARTEKDLYRICPSKLSKRELEDLYFALLEQNVQLKKNINEQRDQIKVLNTRLQRMTVQKPGVGFHNRDCCAGSRAIINEQKESIADLKKANERLSERLRLLNMRLCSAKQFLRRSSCQTASHCSKCLVSNASIKNSSMSALNTKRSDSKLRIDSSSCQIEKENIKVQSAEIDIPTQSAEITSSQAEIPVQDAPCRRNDCKTEIDELKLKIVSLQEEMCSVRRSHSERMRALETAASAAAGAVAGLQTVGAQIAGTQAAGTQVAEAQAAGSQAAGSQAAEAEFAGSQAAGSQAAEAEFAGSQAAGSQAAEAEFAGSQAAGAQATDAEFARSQAAGAQATEAHSAWAQTASSQRAARLAGELRASRQRADELATQLQLQRARTSELSAHRRDDDVTGRLDRAAATLSSRPLPLSEALLEDPPAPVPSDWENCVPILVPNNSGISIFVEDKGHKNSDDSGFTDYKNKEAGEGKETTLLEQDDHIESQAADYRSQLDYLRANTATETETPGVPLGAESSLSHDIFSTSRFKTLPELDKVLSTTRLPEVLVSTDRVNVEEMTEKTQRYGPEFKYNIPAPLSLEMPIISLGDTEADIIAVENEVTDKSKDNRGKGSIKVNSGTLEQKQELVDGDKNTIIDSLEKSNQIIQDIIEEGKTNNAFKKNKRSSIRPPYESKQSRDLAVRYGQTQTYGRSDESVTNTKNVSQGTEIDKLYVEPEEDHESDPSVQYKMNERASIRRIRYMNDVQTDPYTAPESKSLGFHRNDNGARRDGTLRDDDGGARGPALSLDNDMQETIADVDRINPALCAGLSRVCECPPGAAPGPVRLRTCSGAAPAAPPARPPRLRACACASSAPSRSPSQNGTRREETLSDPPRSPVPDTSRSDYVSPGEERAASAQTESCATTDGGSLSEGEVPAAGGKRLTTNNITEPIWGNRSEKMEEALRSISEELTRCRELLQGRREQVSAQSSPRPSQSPPGGRSALSLRRAEGSCRMRNSYTPKCIFTLHVGTVVLADQAAAGWRGRSLLVRWCFYRQANNSTRALQGRVCNYDCTTHYDLHVTQHFLYYLKHEEMPIVIAEMEKQDQALATCALPLRDALLHPNRRVDMSLALVPVVPGGEEAGVLDVWCSLRVDSAALPAINSAIVRPSLKSQYQASSMDQILDEEQSLDYRFSRDLHLRRSKGASEDNQSYHGGSLDKEPELKPKYNEVIENEVPTNIRSVNDFKNAVAKKSNDSTSIYEMLKNKKWPRRSTLGSQKTQEGGRQKSVTICNPVPCSSADRRNISQATSDISAEENLQSLDITILWLSLNEDCRAMSDPSVKRLYVAYSFLGRSGADLETPISLPKPKNYMDKCHFLFKKTFLVGECDAAALGRLARCVPAPGAPDPACAVLFSVVSEPADDPLGLDSCVDIGYAYLFLGEVLSRTAGSSYTAVLEVKDERGVCCGALAVRLDGLAVLRRCREQAGATVSAGGSRLDRARSHDYEYGREVLQQTGSAEGTQARQRVQEGFIVD